MEGENHKLRSIHKQSNENFVILIGFEACSLQKRSFFSDLRNYYRLI